MRDFEEITTGETANEDDELLMRAVGHGPVMGSVHFSTTDGDFLGFNELTLDHSHVGDAMRPHGEFGAHRAEDLLYADLSPEQQAIKDMLDDARADKTKDLS